MSKKSNIYATEKMAQQIASAKEAHERSAGRKISHATFLRTLRSSYDISNADYQKVRTGRNHSTADFIIALYETHKISPHKLFFGRDWNLVANLLSHPNYDRNVVIRYLLSASDSFGNTLESIQNRDTALARMDLLTQLVFVSSRSGSSAGSISIRRPKYSDAVMLPSRGTNETTMICPPSTT